MPAGAGASHDMLAVVLAAGAGTRMRSSTPKVLHELAGQPLLAYPVALARAAGAHTVAVVHAPGQGQAIAGAAEGCRLVEQPAARGTGDAVASVPGELRGSDEVLVLYGDVPLLTLPTLSRLLGALRAGDAECALLAARLRDPRGYGRVIADETGFAIVEEADATPGQAEVDLVNTGVCAFKASALWLALERLTTSTATGEYYLTEVFGLLRGVVVECGEEEALGVNDRWQLAQAERVVRGRINRALAEAGVTIVDPATTYVDAGVTLGADVRVEPFTFLRGATSIGAGSRIGPFAEITDSRVGSNCSIGRSHLVSCTVEDRVEIGPFNRLRAGAAVGEGARIGSYAEIKNSVVGPGSDVHHFSYLGDAVLGRGVNIGAGTVTANYDGVDKHPTRIGDGVFIGTDTTLVAPVSVGDGAYTAAGSVITRDVAAESLAIERAEQRQVEGWARRRRGKPRGQPPE